MSLYDRGPKLFESYTSAARWHTLQLAIDVLLSGPYGQDPSGKGLRA